MIVEAVIRAVSPNIKLRSYLEMMNDMHIVSSFKGNLTGTL